MATGVLATPPVLQFFNNAGLVAANGSVLTQVGGINTATYQDVALSTPLPNPIPLNSRGEVSTATGVSAQCFLTPNITYVFTLFDGPNATGNQLWQATYVNGVQTSLTQTSIAQLLFPQTAAETAASITPTNYQFPAYTLPRYMSAGQLADYLANTALVDQTSALVSAEAVAYVGGIGKIYAPAGIYRIAGTQNLRSGVVLEGDSATSEYYPGSPYNTIQVTQFWKKSTDKAGPVFILNTSSALANLYVRSDAKSNTGIVQKGPLGLSVSMFRSAIKRVAIYGNATGDVSGASTCIGVFFPDGGIAAGGQIYFSELDDVTITNCDRALSLHNQASANRFNNITTRQCYQHYYLSGANGLVGTLGSITAGSGYVNGTYTYVGLTGGTGLGCVVNITVSGGGVTAVTLLTGGTGYTVNDSLTCANSLLGGSGSGFSVKVGSTNSENSNVENVFTGLVVQNIGGLGFGLGAVTGGSGYTSGTYNNVPFTGGTGTGMMGTFVVTGGIVTSTTITTFGSGYVVNDVLGVSNTNLGGAGSGFAQTVINAGGSVCFTLKNTCQNNVFAGYSTECSGTAFNIDASCLNNQFYGHENESGFPSFVPPNNVHGIWAPPINRTQLSTLLIPNVATPNTYNNVQGSTPRYPIAISGTLPQLNGNGTLTASDVNSKVIARFHPSFYAKGQRPGFRANLTVFLNAPGGGVGEGIVEVEFWYLVTNNSTNAGQLSVISVTKKPASNYVAGLKFLTGVSRGSGTFTGNTTLGSPIITNVTPPANLQVGDSISGTGLASNYFVSAIGANTVTMSQPGAGGIAIPANATANGTGTTITWAAGFGLAVVGGNVGAVTSTHLLVDLNLYAFTHDTNTVNEGLIRSIVYGTQVALAADVTDAIDLLTVADSAV